MRARKARVADYSFSGADALILDLEDSVPLAEKAEARGTVAATIDRLRRRRPSAEGVIALAEAMSAHA
ncbi:aldolase/citrate lyase family protein [Nocardia sp. bgisy134]|uniref:aldolase/citrate lyase family protein n=1 Tax=unclassified Nocardia TaxID=2637762 RepID=UPI003D739A0D